MALRGPGSGYLGTVDIAVPRIVIGALHVADVHVAFAVGKGRVGRVVTAHRLLTRRRRRFFIAAERFEVANVGRRRRVLDPLQQLADRRVVDVVVRSQ